MKIVLENRFFIWKQTFFFHLKKVLGNRFLYENNFFFFFFTLKTNFCLKAYFFYFQNSFENRLYYYIFIKFQTSFKKSFYFILWKLLFFRKIWEKIWEKHSLRIASRKTFSYGNINNEKCKETTIINCKENKVQKF